MLVLSGQIDEKLKDARIDVINTPRYIENFQIDETAFEKALDDEVSYFNPRAKEYDINSVRSIYVLRAHTSPTIVERSKAALVTSNAAFSRAAFQYGQRYEASREVSSVITDFSLANMAWLKAPLGRSSHPDDRVVGVLLCGTSTIERTIREVPERDRKARGARKDHRARPPTPKKQSVGPS